MKRKINPDIMIVVKIMISEENLLNVFKKMDFDYNFEWVNLDNY